MGTQRLVATAMFAAVAFVVMAVVQVPLLPYAPYLTYDPSDAVGLLAGVLYGPGAGVTVVLLKDALFFLLRARGPIGPAADFIAAATFVAVTAWAYRRVRGSFARRLIYAAAAGTAARVLIMIPANFGLLALQFGMTPSRVAGMLLPVIVPFNAVKAAANALIALLGAEPVVRAVGSRTPVK
ncbi:MAG TPA: ECF transporter S component [bacterium]|nr:ECF transporter S component [bacterium]